MQLKQWFCNCMCLSATEPGLLATVSDICNSKSIQSNWHLSFATLNSNVEPGKLVPFATPDQFLWQNKGLYNWLLDVLLGFHNWWSTSATDCLGPASGLGFLQLCKWFCNWLLFRVLQLFLGTCNLILISTTESRVLQLLSGFWICYLDSATVFTHGSGN
jgi:hypothetical protein